MHLRALFAAPLLVVALPAAPTPWSANEQAMVTRYCVGCHSDRQKAGGLTLQGASAESDTREKVIRRLRVRSMPPAGLPRPDEAGYQSILASLEATQDRAYAARPLPGRPDTFRRLNRTEYRNSIRDLLHLEKQPGAKSYWITRSTPGPEKGSMKQQF